MNSLLLDLSTALRFFARRRAAFCVIVFTMALALGANTAVFSVLKAFPFAHLAVPEPERIVAVWTTKDLPGRGSVNFSDAYPNYTLLRQSTHSFSALGAALQTDVNWEQTDDTRRLRGQRVTASFFAVMQSRPTLGRLFTAQEEGPRAAPLALISDALWRNAFAADPAVLGRTLRLNGAPHTIIGVTLAAASTELRTFAPLALTAHPENKDWGWLAQPLREVLRSGADNALLFAQAGTGILLVLAITNLAALLLAWAAERQRETAARLALGASGWRLVRQFLVQRLTLVAVGGALGVLLAWFSLPALHRLNPNPTLATFLTHLELDRATLGFAALLVLGTGLLAGLLPAWQARSVSFQEALRSESRGASLSRGALGWQRAMVVVQASVSVLILVGTGLPGLGFYQLGRVPLGFRRQGGFQSALPRACRSPLRPVASRP